MQSLKAIAENLAVMVVITTLWVIGAKIFEHCLRLFDRSGWRAFKNRQVFSASEYLLNIPKVWFGRLVAASLLLLVSLLCVISVLPWRYQWSLLEYKFLSVPVYLEIMVVLLGGAFYFFSVNKRRSPALRYERWAIEFG